jgi:hypothetical protein
MNLLELPIEILWCVVEFLDLDSIVAMTQTVPSHRAFFTSLVKRRIVKRMRKDKQQRGILELAGLTDIELTFLANIITLITNRQDSFTLCILNTYIRKNKFKITTSVNFGMQKYTCLLYCDVNLRRFERILSSIVFNNKTLVLYNTFHEIFYEATSNQEHITVLRTLYSNIPEHSKYHSDNFTMVTYTFRLTTHS